MTISNEYVRKIDLSKEDTETKKDSKTKKDSDKEVEKKPTKTTSKKDK